MKEQEPHLSVEVSVEVDPDMKPVEERIYLPFLAAIERNIIDPSAVNLYKPGDVSMLISNGYMPKQGAVINLPDDRYAAYDLVEAGVVDGEIRLLPTSKDVVNDETKRIQGPGLIVLTWLNGRVKFVANLDRGPINILEGKARRFGNLATKSLVMDPGCEYEAKDIDGQGAVIISPRRRYL